MQGNRLIVRRVRADTESFHARGYPLHEKSTDFPDGKNITPLSQNSLSAVCISMFLRHFSLAGSLCANPPCHHCRHAEGVYFSGDAVLQEHRNTYGRHLRQCGCGVVAVWENNDFPAVDKGRKRIRYPPGTKRLSDCPKVFELMMEK